MKRKQELEEFNDKTETKEGLFDELKRMDMNLKDKQADVKRKEEENQRRLEMFRKARQDTTNENLQEKEAVYQKRVNELEKKEKPKQSEDDWMNAKAFGEND